MLKSAIIAFVLICSFATANAQEAATKSPIRKAVRFINNSLLPKKKVFITYEPSTTGNGTNTKVIAPRGSAKFVLEVGTKVYLADNSQVDYVMDGKNLSERGDKPFCTVTDKENQKFILP